MLFRRPLVTFSIIVLISSLHFSARSFTKKNSKEDKKFDHLFKSFSSRVDKERIRNNVFYLAEDPLPRRVLNWSRPGKTLSSLEEADAWIIQHLSSSGYHVKTDETRVQAFRRDITKPVSKQFSPPLADDPWYIAHNIIAEKKGKSHPEDLIIIVAHKDSQSWIASPGANDNAIGTCGALELALTLRDYHSNHTILFIFCNEEHTPWTSVTAAKNIKTSGVNVLAVFNLDGIGVKSPQQNGTMVNMTRYSTPEGEKIADLIANLNTRCALGLDQKKIYSQSPGDDDGSFIKAGFPWSVRNAGSIPNADPYYHTEKDLAANVDVENAKRTVQLTLAAILHIDRFGRP